MNFIKKLFLYIISKIRNSAKSMWRLICKAFFSVKCLIMLLTGSETEESMHELSYYYPNTGRISLEKGFENSAVFDLSIIITMYNIEYYIVECLKSILNQDSKYSVEIILIDDGSADETVKRVQPFLNENVILFSQTNQGQSVARNNAIKKSRGKYIAFVDGDDILMPGAVNALMDKAYESESDVVEGSFVKFYAEISDSMINDSKGTEKTVSYKDNPFSVLISYGYSWAKVYKRKVWESLRFPEGYIFEDIITKFIIKRKANRVEYIENVVYGYRFNSNSSSHVAHSQESKIKKFDSFWVLPKVFEMCDTEKVMRDEIFYLLSLNHIGLLDYMVSKSFDRDIRLAGFREMRKQLEEIQEYRPKHLPMMFYIIEKSILNGDFKTWDYTARLVYKYQMLTKYREIN